MRGRGGWSQSRGKHQEPAPPDLLKHPLGDLICAIQTCDLAPPLADPSPLPQIHDTRYVTSYNWLAGKDCTISVPGKQ